MFIWNYQEKKTIFKIFVLKLNKKEQVYIKSYLQIHNYKSLPNLGIEPKTLFAT